MQKNNIKILGLFSIIIIIAFAGYTVYSNYNSKNTVIVRNNSNSTLYKMYLKYNTSGETIDIGELNPNDTYKYKVKSGKEESISLAFTDSNNIKYNEVVVGYTYPDMKGVKVIIKDSNNKNRVYLKIK